jgi:cytochrome c biogenesis protein CcmG, thiol:disulfide interchange protein DsbE
MNNMSRLVGLLTMVAIGCIAPNLVFAQDTARTANQLPEMELKDMEGGMVPISSLYASGSPALICFWATWCSPCKRELNNYAELYEDWQDETGVQIVAVSIDDSRSVHRVAPYVNSVMWDYTVLLDPNKDFARAMQVVNVPHTFLVNGDGQVVWQHNNYSDGDEEEVYAQLLKLAP